MSLGLNMSGNLNICGIVVHLAPGEGPAVTTALAALPGLEIHAESGDGRLVATVTDTPEALAIDQLAAINRIPGVVSTTLAYHVFDEAEPEACASEASSCCCGGGGECRQAESHSHHS